MSILNKGTRIIKEVAKPMHISCKLRTVDRKLQAIIKIGSSMITALPMNDIGVRPKVKLKVVPIKTKYPTNNKL